MSFKPCFTWLTTLATGGLWPIAAQAQVDPYARNPVQLGVDVPLTGKGPQGFDDSAAACLRNHPWPGNLRELRNAVERAVILARGGSLTDAASILGIDQATLYRKRKKFGME